MYMHFTPQQGRALCAIAPTSAAYAPHNLHPEFLCAAHQVRCTVPWIYTHTPRSYICANERSICIHTQSAMRRRAQCAAERNAHPVGCVQSAEAQYAIPRCRTCAAGHRGSWVKVVRTLQFSFQFSVLSRVIQVDGRSYSNSMPLYSMTH